MSRTPYAKLREEVLILGEPQNPNNTRARGRGNSQGGVTEHWPNLFSGVWGSQREAVQMGCSDPGEVASPMAQVEVS